MTAQPDFFLKPIDARFEAFHKSNPAVLRLFIAFAEKAKEAGKRRVGAKRIAEVIRWELEVETRNDTFRLNNSYVSRYARLVANERPDLAPLFKMRALKS